MACATRGRRLWARKSRQLPDRAAESFPHNYYAPPKLNSLKLGLLCEKCRPKHNFICRHAMVTHTRTLARSHRQRWPRYRGSHIAAASAWSDTTAYYRTHKTHQCTGLESVAASTVVTSVWVPSQIANSLSDWSELSFSAPESLSVPAHTCVSTAIATGTAKLIGTPSAVDAMFVLPS